MPDAKAIAQALGRAKRSGPGWSCLCPTHDDHDPSLSVTDSDDGHVLVHCHAGCAPEGIIAVLKERGLWPNQPKAGHSSRPKSKSETAKDTWTPILPVPPGAPKPNFDHPKYGRAKLKWEYRNQQNQRLGYVLRYETQDDEKTFRPLTYCENAEGVRAWRYRGFPKPFPLYGLDRLASRPDAPVIITEGEKAADCAGQLVFDMVAISWPHGARSVDDVDWSPLEGRVVHVWPDADDEGMRAAQKVCRRCLETGAKSVRLITPPKDVPNGWDAADALAEGYASKSILKLAQQAREIKLASPQAVPSRLNLAEWRADRYSGQPPLRKWLVENILPLAAPCLVAAIGGVGKSMLMLKLSLRVATGDLCSSEHNKEPVLGGNVACHGSAVLITAEDDADEVHRRLSGLDPANLRLHHPERLVVVPLPNAGGILTLLRGGFDSPEVTNEYEDLYLQLIAIPDLKLIVFDPLQAFVGADANKDPAAGQYLCTLLGKLAADTGATVIMTHHFRKQGRNFIRTPSEARDAVRGTTALVDGMRCVYALWQDDVKRAKKVCAELGIKYETNRVVRGAVIKANWPVELKMQTYVRNDVGLLCDHTGRLSQPEDRKELLAQLVEAIERAATEGKPYTKTGKSGVHDRRDELPRSLRRVGRNRLQDMVQELLHAKRASQSATGKSGVVKWLDVPGGPFDRGEGSFAAGALKARQ